MYTLQDPSRRSAVLVGGTEPGGVASVQTTDTGANHMWNWTRLEKLIQWASVKKKRVIILIIMQYACVQSYLLWRYRFIYNPKTLGESYAVSAEALPTYTAWLQKSHQSVYTHKIHAEKSEWPGNILNTCAKWPWKHAFENNVMIYIMMSAWNV